MCQGSSRKDLFGVVNHQFPVPRDEIKRMKSETLACRRFRVSRRFEFGGVF